jgi:16S rRNA (cytosine967-C5)-methyltransferase
MVTAREQGKDSANSSSRVHHQSVDRDLNAHFKRMAISAARITAFEILLRVEREQAYASALLNASRYSELSPADHALATELTMGVLRWQSRLDREIAQFSSPPLSKLDLEVLIALRLAAYQILFLDRIPARAAVHESVELVKFARKRSATGYANATLRKIASRAKRQDFPTAASRAQTIPDLSEAAAHPSWLIERWAVEFGFEAARRICIFDQQAPATAIAVPDPALEEQLAQQNVILAPGRLLSSARRVAAGELARKQLCRESRIAIQDEASRLVALLAGHGANILDCCAAPGGKTRVLAEQNPNSKIVAAELHCHRAKLLRKLVPHKNVTVINTDIHTFEPKQLFDLVVADVPCSGTGTIARNPEIKWRLKPADLADFEARQLAILRSAMRHVRLGGRLLYSTCSLEPEENHVVIEKLATEASFAIVDCRQELERLRMEGQLLWKSTDSLLRGRYLRTIPGVHPCDGFFAAILEKSGN